MALARGSGSGGSSRVSIPLLLLTARELSLSLAGSRVAALRRVTCSQSVTRIPTSGSASQLAATVQKFNEAWLLVALHFGRVINLTSGCVHTWPGLCTPSAVHSRPMDVLGCPGPFHGTASGDTCKPEVRRARRSRPATVVLASPTSGSLPARGTARPPSRARCDHGGSQSERGTYYYYKLIFCESTCTSAKSHHSPCAHPALRLPPLPPLPRATGRNLT